MGWMEFVSSLFGHLLSWPVVVAVVVVIFRRPLRELIGRIRSYEGLGQRIDFGEKLAGAENSVDQAVGGIETDQGVAADEDLTTESPLVREAEANPSFVIISAWERLTGALADLVGATTNGISRRPTRAPASMLRELERSEVVNAAYVRAVDDLRALRNQVAHGQHNPTAGEAIAYADSAEELVRAAQVLADLHAHRRRTQGGATAPKDDGDASAARPAGAPQQRTE
ncbi:hypothetical protein ACIA8B_24110 [Micromonospora chalcea]